MRVRLFAALLLAAAPGVVFGAIEARRNYEVASQQDAAVRGDDATRAAVRLDDAVKAAADGVAVMATRRELRRADGQCVDSLRAAAKSQSRYAAFARTNAAGRVICSSSDAARAIDVGEAEWFNALKGGAAYAVSALAPTPYVPAEPALIVGVPMRDGETFIGTTFAVIPKSWLQSTVAMELGAQPGAIVVYDRRGAIVAEAAREMDATKVSQVATLALAASTGMSKGEGLMAERVAAVGKAFSVVAVSPSGKQTEIGLRSALIVLAPILVAALSFAVVWLALDWWVLRWFYKLQDTAKDFGAGRYAPAAMRSAPSEIKDLAEAFDVAVGEARTRERDLAAALASNMSLTRELHHRVKNNLQVLSSLVSRQQRRTEEPVVRNALSEARARMAPVALVYRFINPPEERTAIDLQPYLNELARQLHVALGGDSRGIKLNVEVERGFRSADDATNIGLIVAEALITGYANAAGMSAATANLTWKMDASGAHVLSVGVRNGAATGRERPLDKELIQEIARQLNTEAAFEAPATVSFPLKMDVEPAAP